MKKLIWFFNWLPGLDGIKGYNCVYAISRNEAIEQIEKQFGTCKLKVDLSTLRVVSQEFIDKIDSAYAGMFY